MTRITKHFYLTSLLLTAVSIAIGTNQPVNGAPIGSDSKMTMVAKSTSKMKFKPQAAAPEAGVQLLMGILQRIGSEPLVALQKGSQSQRADDTSIAAAAKTAFLASAANGVDPALMIRPQQQQQAVRRERAYNSKSAPQTQSEQLLAMLPKKQEAYQRYAADKDSSRGTYGDESSQLPPASFGMASAGAPGFANYRQSKVAADKGVVETLQGAQSSLKRTDGAKVPNLQTSINKLYSATKFFEDITATKGLGTDAAPSEEMQANLVENEGRVIRTGSRSLGNRISNAPRIDEFSGGKNVAYGSQYNAGKSTASMDAVASDDFKSRDADAGVTYMKPENPSGYKTTKEWGMPATPEPLAEMKKAKPSSSFSGGGVAVAYIPPQLVAGIPGLRLGVSEAAVDSYIKGKGIVHRQQVNNWKVTSVTSNSTGKTALQIYLRNGTVQAYRVFDQEFVPDGLGVNLNGKLSSMKKKFGQQQFILDEPSASDTGLQGARNYVYPVNQISFQLARTTPKDQPTIQSLLLFQFL